jgi:hypothetical protein
MPSTSLVRWRAISNRASQWEEAIAAISAAFPSATSAELRRGIGLWNPPSTRLVLVSPGKLCVPPAPIVEALDGKMPVFG